MLLKRISLGFTFAVSLLLADSVRSSSIRFIPSVKVGMTTNTFSGLTRTARNFNDTYVLTDILAVLAIPAQYPHKKKLYEAFYGHHLKSEYVSYMISPRHPINCEHVVLTETHDDTLDAFLRETRSSTGFASVVDHGLVFEKLNLKPDAVSLVLFKRGVLDDIREIDADSMPYPKM